VNWKKLFDPRGTNLWLTASGIGLNVIWTLGALTFTTLVLGAGERSATPIQAGLLLSAYLGPFLSGWLMARMAGDRRGPTYGAVGSLGSLLLWVVTLIPAGGLLGLMAAVLALAGGITGGTMGQPR
jgi:hypothetical protein